MPRPIALNPKYCRDKSNNRAFVTLGGRKVSLGVWNTPDSIARYDRAIAEWISRGRPAVALPTAEPSPAFDGPSVNVIIAGFVAWAAKRYGGGVVLDGRRPRGELGNYWDVLRPLRRLYGTTPAMKFGPRALKALRQEMVDRRLARSHINRQVLRLKSVFRWATENELLPADVYGALRSVRGLRYGEDGALEAEPVRPVHDADVAAVLSHLSRHVRAMVELQVLTGMRPGEACAMRIREIDTSGKVWVYRPPHHKTAHHGKTREIRIGPRAQDLLRPFLRHQVDAHVFSPAEAEKERHAALRDARTTPAKPWEHRRDRSTEPRQRAPQDHYTTASYRRAIDRACMRAFRMPAELKEPTTAAAIAADTPAAQIARREARAAWRAEHVWTPNQLRHNAATAVRRQYGLEAASVILGHSSTKTTEIYAEIDTAKADLIMFEVG
ncbi:MAG TPA: site-specific integrase [Tepidisphaeraceae bacterium]|jgi:integrase|nr:site-specific integrase [Tepidisphaeraceae bacterium]